MRPASPDSPRREGKPDSDRETKGLRSARVKRERDDEACEREIATASGRDKKAKAARSNLAAAAFVEGQIRSAQQGQSVRNLCRQIVDAALDDPSHAAHMEAIAFTLGQRMELAAMAPPGQDPVVEGVLLAWASWVETSETPDRERPDEHDAVLLDGLLRGMGTAASGDNAGRFDRLLRNSAILAASSKEMCELTGDNWKDFFFAIAESVIRLLRSDPPPAAQLFNSILFCRQIYLPTDGCELTPTDLTKLMLRHLEAMKDPPRHRHALVTLLLENEARLGPNELGVLLARLTDSATLCGDQPLLRRLLQAPALTAQEKGMTLLVGSDRRMVDSHWDTTVLISEGDRSFRYIRLIDPEVVGKILIAAGTLEQRFTALVCLLYARRDHLNWRNSGLFGERFGFGEEVQWPWEENEDITGYRSMLERLDSKLCAAIASIAADCSQAQLTELGHHLAQFTPVPAPPADPKTPSPDFDRLVDSLMPPVPAGESKAEAVAQRSDRAERRAWIAAGLRLPAQDITEVAKLKGLTSEEQAALYDVGRLRTGEMSTQALEDELRALWIKVADWGDTPAALKAAVVGRSLRIVGRAFQHTAPDITPNLLRYGRARFVAERMEAIKQSVERQAPLDAEQADVAARLPQRLREATALTEEEKAVQARLDERAVIGATELTELMEQLLVLYQRHLDAAGLPALLAASQPLQDPQREAARGALDCLQRELIELMDAPALWKRAEGTLGVWMRQHIRNLRRALGDEAPLR